MRRRVFTRRREGAKARRRGVRAETRRRGGAERLDSGLMSGDQRGARGALRARFWALSSLRASASPREPTFFVALWLCARNSRAPVTLVGGALGRWGKGFLAQSHEEEEDVFAQRRGGRGGGGFRVLGRETQSAFGGALSRSFVLSLRPLRLCAKKTFFVSSCLRGFAWKPSSSPSPEKFPQKRVEPPDDDLLLRYHHPGRGCRWPDVRRHRRTTRTPRAADRSCRGDR
ncbi:hypothetical protein D9M73_89090 [compost metagenome]